MTYENRNKDETGSRSDAGKPTNVSRRALLKGSAYTMPVILTLHSGAALARSSNLIGAAAQGTRDVQGNALCLDTTRALSITGTNQYDLGDPTSGTVNVLRGDLLYYPEPNRSLAPRSADTACSIGGPHYYHESGWHEFSLPPNGAIVSAAALVSVSLRGTIQINRVS